MTNRKHEGSITLRFLRKLIAPATAFDGFGKDPVYLNVGGRFYELADVSSVAGPHESHTELQAGRELTERETRAAADRKVIDDYPEVTR